jgi:hypothetical protein
VRQFGGLVIAAPLINTPDDSSPRSAYWLWRENHRHRIDLAAKKRNEYPGALPPLSARRQKAQERKQHQSAHYHVAIGEPDTRSLCR